MRVFVTGASGFIGAAIVCDLLAAGHEVIGLARSDASAARIAAAGADVLRGDLTDRASLYQGAAATDGVIHTAFIHDDFSAMDAAAAVDRAAIATFGEALAGSNRPLVITSGLGLLTPGRLITELDGKASASPNNHRVAAEEQALALAEHGVRAMVVRLPPSVHGAGDHGFVPFLIGLARTNGMVAYPEAGDNCWAAVHRLDAARLFCLALELGRAGQRFHGVGEEGVPVREIAAAIGQRLNLPVQSLAGAAAAEYFGWMARFISMHNAASSALTREQLGWQPTGPTLLEDLAADHYFA